MKIPNSKTTFEMLSKSDNAVPKVIFDKNAIKWFEALAEIHPAEVGCLAIVDKLPNYTFFVRDVFYPKHDLATSGTCEISASGSAEVANWLFDHNRSDDVGKINCWGHSHHTMGTSPSTQDEEQAVALMKESKSAIVRCIFNKANEMSVSLYDYEKGIRFDNIVWSITKWSSGECEAMVEKIRNIVNTKDGVEAMGLIEEALSRNDVDEKNKIKAKVVELMKVNIPNSFAPTTNRTVVDFNRRATPEYPHYYTDQYLDLFESDNTPYNPLCDEDRKKIIDKSLSDEQIDKDIDEILKSVGVS